jgi:hypothetical protein
MTPTFIRRFILAIIVSSVLSLATGCHPQSGSSASFFPESGEASGWTKLPEVRTFAPDQLSGYSDGDAEKYLQAGVRSTSTADYKLKDQIQLTVDLYTMSNSAGAKSIFESEPPMNAQTPSLGDAARLYSQSLTFRKGRYLVRMVAYQDSPELTQAMFNLGVAIEKRLPH